jgi:hypothetical protein
MAGVFHGHWGSPSRVKERDGRVACVLLPGRKGNVWWSSRTARCSQRWRWEGDFLDHMRVPEVVSKGKEGEREVECSARKGC